MEININNDGENLSAGIIPLKIIEIPDTPPITKF